MQQVAASSSFLRAGPLVSMRVRVFSFHFFFAAFLLAQCTRGNVPENVICHPSGSCDRPSTSGASGSSFLSTPHTQNDDRVLLSAWSWEKDQAATRLPCGDNPVSFGADMKVRQLEAGCQNCRQEETPIVAGDPKPSREPDRLPSVFAQLTQGSSSNPSTAFVSAVAGSDATGDGSLMNPWKTLVFSLTQGATSVIVIDELEDVNVHIVSNLTISSVAGSSRPALWVARSSGYAMFFAATSPGISVNITLRGLEVSGFDSGAVIVSGILSTSSVSLVLENVTFASNSGSGAALTVTGPAATVWASGLQFLNNSCAHSAGCGGALTLASGGRATLTGPSAAVFQRNTQPTGSGGAIYMEGAHLWFESPAVFLDNSAGISGGAISIGVDSDAYFSSPATFVGNQVTSVGGIGGAVDVNGAGSVVYFAASVTFEGNSVQGGYGGALCVSVGNVSFFSTASFSSNSAIYVESFTTNGGALYVKSEGVLAFGGDTVIVNNTAAGNDVYNSAGGGLAVGGGLVAFLSSVLFAGNSVPSNGNGGALFVSSGSVSFLALCTFESNSSPAGGNGGAFYINSGSILFVADALFSNNEAPGSGAMGGAVNVATSGPIPSCVVFMARAVFAGNYVSGSLSSGVSFGGALAVQGANASFLVLQSFTPMSPRLRTVGPSTLVLLCCSSSLLFCLRGTMVPVALKELPSSQRVA